MRLQSLTGRHRKHRKVCYHGRKKSIRCCWRRKIRFHQYCQQSRVVLPVLEGNDLERDNESSRPCHRTLIRGVINLLKNPILQVGAVLGVSIGLKDTIDTYKDFEAAMSQVKAVSGATGSEFDKLTAKAKEMERPQNLPPRRVQRHLIIWLWPDGIHSRCLMVSRES